MSEQERVTRSVETCNGSADQAGCSKEELGCIQDCHTSKALSLICIRRLDLMSTLTKNARATHRATRREAHRAVRVRYASSSSSMSPRHWSRGALVILFEGFHPLTQPQSPNLKVEPHRYGKADVLHAVAVRCMHDLDGLPEGDMRIILTLSAYLASPQNGC